MEFESRKIVNGAYLRRFLNQKVSLFVKITNVDGSGKMLRGKTTDNIELKIQLNSPINSPIEDWVEIIGVPNSPDSIHCTDIIFIENKHNEELDTESHNLLVQYLNNCKNIFNVS